MTSFNPWLVVLAASCLASACAHSPSSSPLAVDACQIARSAQNHSLIRVPFEIVDGRIYVQARVNGRGPYRFAVDTGASGMGRADASLVQALGLSTIGQAQNADGVRSAQADTVLLDSLELGGLVQRELEVIAKDYGSRLPEAQRFHGIIGRNFFADGLLVIDYPNRSLSFSKAVKFPVNVHNGLS